MKWESAYGHFYFVWVKGILEKAPGHKLFGGKERGRGSRPPPGRPVKPLRGYADRHGGGGIVGTAAPPLCPKAA